MTQYGHRDLKVWQRAMQIVMVIYRITERFPSHERFGLTAQLRRAAVRVPSDIAEGNGRRTHGEYRNLLSGARGSLKELETQIEIAHQLAYIQREDYDVLFGLCDEVSRMLRVMMRRLG